MNENFLSDKNVDEFVSAIWTERYTSAGEMQLVMRPTPEWISALAPGTFVGLVGSKDVMIVETHSIENGLLTIAGRDLLTFLDERMVWFRNPDSSSEDLIVDYSATDTPGHFLADVVNKMVIAPAAIPTTALNLDWANDKIPGLVLGAVDLSGTAQRLTIPIGPLYSGLQGLADQFGVGIALYLDSASPITGYVLKFTTYQGRDLTSDQTVNPLVRLSPDLDTLSDVKEINSISGYKNVAYVYYNGSITTHYADPTAPIPEGFARRVMVVDPEGEPVGHKFTVQAGINTYSGYTVDASDIAAFRAQAAKDALANHNYIHAVDGQTSPISEYKYGTDYKMGDILELESFMGTLSKARVTEYVRSQDSNGERAYPTISVIG